ncbi:MAG: ComEC/Rec2 family competence protein, partial [Muribaculaceae bacterium]|nr:ComEC/Rec2 family competence protein [Muribaculaceae bacterium]
LLSGDRAYLEPDVRQKFSDAGIAHVFALSGMHIAIIAAIFLSILFPLNFFGKYKLRYFITAILLWLYAFITGMSPSIIRACVMASTFIIAMLLERKNTTLNSLCLSGFLILLFTPRALFEIGFQLSFLCVGSLILFAGKFNPINHRMHPRLYRFVNLINASLITTFTTWLVVAYYFQSFPTLFLPSNLLILPLLPFYVATVILYFILELTGIHIEILAKAIDAGYDGMMALITVLGEESAINLTVSKESVMLWLIGLLILAIAIWKWKNRIFYYLGSLCFLISFGLALFYPQKIQKGFIICHSYPHPQIKISDGIIETSLNIPLNSISLSKINEKNIIILDCKNLPLDIIKAEDTIDYLVITGKYKGTLSEIQEVFNPRLLIIHSSIRKMRENELIEQATQLRLSTYSLRKQNALKVIKE